MTYYCSLRMTSHKHEDKETINKVNTNREDIFRDFVVVVVVVVVIKSQSSLQNNNNSTSAVTAETTEICKIFKYLLIHILTYPRDDVFHLLHQKTKVQENRTPEIADINSGLQQIRKRLQALKKHPRGFKSP